jgi:threonylcarbamoyladenosine tRNA methylthiotransferase MtaB
MKYAVLTFGCRVNQADSLAVEAQLQAAGGHPVPAEQADVVVVNTCSVTAAADQGARQTVRRVARANPAARIVVTGCYATRRPGDVAELPGVARVVGNDDKPRLLALVRAVGPAEAAVSGLPTTADRFGDGSGSCGASIAPGIAGRTAFSLRVQTGCAETCSYCIIPETRGRPQSVPVDTVCAEVRRIAAAGFREIVLTGVHLGSYGRDLGPAASLSGLLRALDVLTLENGPVLLRVSSLEPMDCTPEIVELVAASERFAPHFHLPLQHGSRKVLAAMRRPYSPEYFAGLVGRIHARLPDAAIGSDVIAGFPGETDDDFEQLAEYLQRSPLTHVHVFPYSDRPGTEATLMHGKVPGAVVRERARRLRDISAHLTQRFRTAQVGSVHRALTLEDGSLVVTPNYLKLRIPPGRNRNEWVRVRVCGGDEGLWGEPLDGQG